MTNNMLEVQDVHTYIGQYKILQGVSLEVPAKSITALLGRNGAGKTTTLRTIIGLLSPSQGKIIYKGEEIQGKQAFKIAKMGIGFVPDYRAIFKHLTVEENLSVAERKKGDLERKKDFIFNVFPDLEKLYRWPGGQLSGGQQQMLAVARALVPDNQLLLIDEPSEGLAPVIIEQMVSAIQQLSDETTILLVEQNFDVACALADQYVIIEDGKSVMKGHMLDLVSDEATITKYLSAA